MGGFFDYLRMILGWYSAPPAATPPVNPLYSPVFYSRVVGLAEWNETE